MVMESEMHAGCLQVKSSINSGSAHRLLGIKIHLIKVKSEITFAGEVTTLFCHESGHGRGKIKQNWNAALAGLTTEKKTRPQ